MRSLFLLCFVALGYCLGDDQSGGDLLKDLLNLGMKGRLFDGYTFFYLHKFVLKLGLGLTKYKLHEPKSN